MVNLSQIKELLNQILNKLETTELKIERQAEEINKYIQKHGVGLDAGDLLIAQGKATKTSIELLREEIEKLHQVVKVIFQQPCSEDKLGSAENSILQDCLQSEGNQNS
jgi:hypothetical protein